MDELCEGIRMKGVSIEIKNDRRDKKKKRCCADPTQGDKGTMMMRELSVC
jgi:hypothetical protein